MTTGLMAVTQAEREFVLEWAREWTRELHFHRFGKESS